MHRDNSNHDRRAFLKRAVGAVGGVVLAAGILPVAGCEEVTMKHPTEPLPSSGLSIVDGTLLIDTTVDGLTTLASSNGYALVSGVAGLPERILVIRINETTVSAVSEVCTHAGCNISPSTKGVLSSDRIECPCHGSVFAASSGAVLRGPATSPLRRYQATITGSIIRVVLS